ncbi:unnamed protein product [Mucor hiemalis]
MITTSMNPLTDEYKLMNSDSLFQGSTTPLYNDNNNNGIIVDNNNVVVPDLLVEKSTSEEPPSSAEEAVFLPTYATLPTTKLEEEPNPFEQSFEATTAKIPKLPSIDNRLNGMEWDSLRSGILSPSMLPGPTGRRPVKYEVNTPSTSTTFYNHTYENPPTTVNRKHTRSHSETTTTNKRQKKSKSSITSKENDPEDEEKRKNFLERNRIAALKCRQRKKQWLQNLQTKVEYLAADNEQYHMQANALREELINLKTLLMAHKECPINQQELKIALNRPIPGVPNLPHLLSSTNTNNEDNNED